MNKLKLYFTLLFCIVFFSSFSQKGSIGVSFTNVGKGYIFEPTHIEQSGNRYIGNRFFSASLHYFYPLNDKISAETGVNYDLLFFDKFLPNQTASGQYKYENLSLPFGLRTKALNVFFLQSGLLVDVLEQGVGSYFGGGFHFESEYGIGIMVNPYLKIHNLIPLNLDFGINRAMDTGVKVGITYKFDNVLSK